METKTILYRLNFYDIDKKIEDFYKQELTADEAFQILYQDYILLFNVGLFGTRFFNTCIFFRSTFR